MRKIEKEEEILSYDDPDRKTFHLCIVNLVIGTLYCAKGNYQVGHGIPKELAVVLLNYQIKSFKLKTHVLVVVWRVSYHQVDGALQSQARHSDLVLRQTMLSRPLRIAGT